MLATTFVFLVDDEVIDVIQVTGPGDREAAAWAELTERSMNATVDDLKDQVVMHQVTVDTTPIEAR
jgi:hypothetical protein